MSQTLQRLLIVDPDHEAGKQLVSLAGRYDIEARALTTAAEFIEHYSGWQPTLICLSLNLVDMDGIELLRWLSNSNDEARVIITGDVDKKVLNTAASLAAARNLDVVGTLRKPFATDDVSALFEATQMKQEAVTLREIEQAFGRGEIVLRYQPKVSLGDERDLPLRGVEALVRWHHPVRGILSPDRFLGAIAEFGLMGRLTDRVIEIAFSDLARWTYLPADFTMAINVPGDLLSDLELPDKIEQRARMAGIDPRRVVIEITESVALDDQPTTLDVLTRMRLKGFALALDDFGTGYSSLVELYRMPFSEIKIDRSFVSQVERDQDARTIVRSIVGLGHNLGLRVVAEGVETSRILSFLKEIGCEEAQGYFITVPLSAEGFENFTRRWAKRKPPLRVISENPARRSKNAAYA
ncbi:EAL domain-containing response regulator [Rhodoligotrophos defluvii]|uniref:EAL domain-containing response regulator n=1 Tax=Rhodoligotrophos defluvii TaxID=2561934 RepID=UPI0010C9B4E9|nr:EAL domain-containing response regulator [Rhodoligotrophos defluvii]